jgi:hypothetical protein
MPASDDFLKNLLRVMQKISLAIAAVSIAIFGDDYRVTVHSSKRHKKLPIDESVPKLRGAISILEGIETANYPVLEETVAAALQKLRPHAS